MEGFEDLLANQKKKTKDSLQNLGFSKKKEKTVTASASVSKKQIGAGVKIKV